MKQRKLEYRSKALASVEARLREYDTRLSVINEPTLVERFLNLWLYWISCLTFSAPHNSEQENAFDYYDPYGHRKRAAAGGECFVAAIPMIFFFIWLAYVCILWPYLAIPLGCYLLYVVYHYYRLDGKRAELRKTIFQEKNEKEIEEFSEVSRNSLVKVCLSGVFLSKYTCYDKVNAIVFLTAENVDAKVLLTLVDIEGNELSPTEISCDLSEELDESFSEVLGRDIELTDLSHLFLRGSRVKVADSGFKFWREATLDSKSEDNKEDVWNVIYDNDAKEEVPCHRLYPLCSESEYGIRRVVRPLLHIFAFILMVVVGIGTFAYPVQQGKSPFVQSHYVQPLKGQPLDGTLVLARFKGGAFAFFGRVASRAGDSEFSIDYLDGDKEIVKIESLFQPHLKKGHKVQYGHVENGKHSWIEGTVVDVGKKSMKLKRGDGSLVTLELLKVRVPLRVLDRK